MKLAEALIQRGDLQKRIEQLRSRLERSARIFEGDTIPEEPTELFEELEQLISAFGRLVARINRTNSTTPFDETRTISDGLAERDALMLHRQILEDSIRAATEMRAYNVQIKSHSTFNVQEVQAKIDVLSRQYRELDTRIQGLNWTTELSE